MDIKKKLFFLTALFYVVWMIFPLFADSIRIPVWLPSILVVTVLIALYPQAFANKTFYWFYIYAGILALYVLLGKPLAVGIGTVDDSKKIFIEYAYILPTVGIFCVLSFCNDIKLTRKLVTWSAFLLFVSFVIEVPLMMQYNSIRAALAETGDEFEYVAGLPSYSLMHAYTLYVPVMCYASKRFRGWRKIVSLVGLFILSFVIYDTFVTTSLLMLFFMLIITVLYSKKTNYSTFVITLIALTAVFIILYYSGFFIMLIDWIMPAFVDTPVAFKLNDFRQSMSLGYITGGSITGRQNFHGMSWDAFFRNPILGSEGVGGHSSIMDRFGGMGLLAGIPFVMIIITFIKRMVKLYETKTSRFFFWVGIVVGFAFLYAKGNWGGEAWLMYMVLMPFSIWYLEKYFLKQGEAD